MVFSYPRCTFFYALITLCLGLTLAQAEPEKAQTDEQRAHAIEQQGVAAFNHRDFTSAADFFEAQRTLTPKSFIVHFNLACTRSMLGELDEAEERITRSIELGFDDVHKFRLDPALKPIRSRPIYKDLLNRWPEILELRRKSILIRDKGWTRGRYIQRTDDGLRLEFRSAHSEKTTDDALADLAKVNDYLVENLFTELPKEPWQSHHPWVVVTLPNTRDFAAWARHAVGGAAHGQTTIGGAYDHDAKRLVAQDLGPTLWHEFAHVLHFRDMARNNQQHALWIKEGIGALVETFDGPGAGRSGSFTPVPGWRLNSLKRAKDRGLILTTQKLITLPADQFTGTAGLRNYAHVRAIFLYLYSTHQLKPFYDTYVENYTQDPTGALALTQAAGGTLEDFDAMLAAWLDTLPMVAEDFKDLSATIGADLAPGTGDGPKVVGFGPATKGSHALKLGWVITHINSHPTRDLHELIRVLEPYSPGSVLTLTTRRGKLITEVKTTLVEP